MTSVPTHVLSEYARNQLRDTFADVRQCVIFYFMPYIYCKGALTAESRHAAMLDTCSGRPPPLAGRPPLSAKRASHFVTHSRDQSRHRYISTFFRALLPFLLRGAEIRARL